MQGTKGLMVWGMKCPKCNRETIICSLDNPGEIASEARLMTNNRECTRATP